jgi:HPt (histidine-containing phosphotransfer) domain-containing protein
MDDYLSKPIQVQELLATIERYASPQRGVRETTELPQSQNNSLPERPSAASDHSAFSRTVADGGEPIDLTTLLTRVENDWDLLHEMIELFLESSPRLLAEIEAGMVRHDSQTVERATHALKGAMQSISALPAARAAANLEANARSGDTKDAGEPLSVLKLEFELLVRALNETTAGART